MYRLMHAQLARWFWRHALGAVVVFFSAASIADGAHGAVLSFFEEFPGGVHWRLWDSRDNTFRTLLTTRQKPQLIFWSAGGTAAYYTKGLEIFRLSLADRSLEPIYIGQLPKVAGKVEALWVDTKTRRIRIAAMQPVADADLRKLNGHLVFRAKDGASLPTSDLPHWGRPYIASIWEMGAKKGEWVRVVRRATKSDAGDTPGLSVLADFLDPFGHSNESLLRSYTCDNEQCRNDVPDALVRSASSLVGRPLSSEGLSLWSVNPGGASVLFGIVMGDELHITAPVLLANSGAEGASLLQVGQRGQMGLGVQGGFLLVADELSGSRPIVVDLKLGAVRLQPKNATGAVWLP